MKTGKKVTFGQTAQGTHNAEFEKVETDPSDQHYYEEIPDNLEPDMSTPRSRLRAPVPVRQLQPHRVVLNYTTDQLPGAFLFPPTSQSQFNVQEIPTPLSISNQVQSEENELEVSGEEGRKDENEDEEQMEDDNGEVDWSRIFLGPNSPSMTKEKEHTSYETEKDELKILIDRELQLVHNLEEQINNSAILEGIYTDNKCSLLYQPNILTVNTNPDLLSDSPQERVTIMQDLYEQILKAKEERIKVLERLAEAEHVRRSKRLLRKPKKKYYDN